MSGASSGHAGVSPAVRCWLGGSYGGALIGVFGPWATDHVVTFSGVKYDDGKIAIGGIVLGAIATVLGVIRYDTGWLWSAAVWMGLLVAAAIVDGVAFGNYTGWGIYLLGLASASAAAACVAAIIELRRLDNEPRPPAPRPTRTSGASEETLAGYVSEWNRRARREGENQNERAT